MSDKIVSLGDKVKEAEQERIDAFHASIDSMVAAVKDKKAGAAVILYYTDKDDPSSMRFASNSPDEMALHWMLSKGAQHILDFGYGEAPDGF